MPTRGCKAIALDSQLDFQAGVAPGQGIEGISLAVRSFFALCQTRASCASVAFFDLQAAGRILTWYTLDDLNPALPFK